MFVPFPQSGRTARAASTRPRAPHPLIGLVPLYSLTLYYDTQGLAPAFTLHVSANPIAPMRLYRRVEHLHPDGCAQLIRLAAALPRRTTFTMEDIRHRRSKVRNRLWRDIRTAMGRHIGGYPPYSVWNDATFRLASTRFPVLNGLHHAQAVYPAGAFRLMALGEQTLPKPAIVFTRPFDYAAHLARQTPT